MRGNVAPLLMRRKTYLYIYRVYGMVSTEQENIILRDKRFSLNYDERYLQTNCVFAVVE